MKKCNRSKSQSTKKWPAHRMLNLVCVAVTALIVMVSLPHPAYAHDLKPPRVPSNIQVPAGHKLFLAGHAVGTQNYVCLPSGPGVKFTLFTPQATLFNDRDQITTHYFSPNPAENGTIRATWQHARDTSTVWGQVKDGNSSADPVFVAPDAIPWLLVTAVGTQAGPTGGDKLAETTFIQRLNTAGGVAPATGCASPSDIGKQAFVPYTTDYFFYKKAN